MLPSKDIIEWSGFVPWSSSEHSEQDLVASRSLVALFTDDLIFDNLVQIQSVHSLTEFFLRKALYCQEFVKMDGFS